MKKYLADLLTLTRFVMAIALIVMTFTSGDIAAAFLVFVIGELTDAFDGTCATKWPFPKHKTPKYRKYAAKYDIFTDSLLIAAMFLFFILRVNLIAGLVIGLGFGIVSTIFELVIYGKIMGHPDDFRKGSLSDRNFSLAKTIVLWRRKVYILLIGVVTIWTLYASAWSLEVKLTLTVVAAIIAVFLWFFLAQRRHNISRNAVKTEQKLGQK